MKPSLRALLAVAAAVASVSALAAEDYFVLQVAPEVSKVGSVGWQTQIGAKIYFEETNNRGGVSGHAVKFAAVDQGPDISAQVRDLIKTRQPVALLGTIGPAPVAKLLADRVLETAQLPLVGARTGATALISDKSLGWLFFTRPSYAAEADKVLKQFATIGVKKMAVIYAEDATGCELLAQIKTVSLRYGQSVDAAIPQPRNASQLASVVDSLIQKGHQALLIATDTPWAAAILKRYREKGGAAQIVAMSNVEAAQMAQISGHNVARGTAVVQVAPAPRNDAIQVIREFTTCYRKYGPYTEEPTQAMIEGYLAAKVLVEGLKRGGGGHAALARGLSGMSNYDAGGVSFSFGPVSRSGARYLEISVVDREGRIVH